MRLFTAILFDEIFLDWLDDVQQSLWQAGIGGRYSSRDLLHLTLVFIGETSWLGSAQAALDSVDSKPFTLSTSSLGRFARLNGDIIWIGLEPQSELSSIVNQLSASLLQAGFELEKRAYRPHITLLRDARMTAGIELADFNPPSRRLNVTGVSLMKSENVKGTLIYTEIGWRKLD